MSGEFYRARPSQARQLMRPLPTATKPMAELPDYLGETTRARAKARNRGLLTVGIALAVLLAAIIGLVFLLFR